MKRHISWLTVLAIALVILAGSCATVLYFLSPAPFWLPILLLVVCVVSVIVLLFHIKNILTDWLKHLTGSLDPSQQVALQHFPLPAVLLDADGAILFANDLFIQDVRDGQSPVYGMPMVSIFESLSIGVLSEKRFVDVCLGTRKYSAYITAISPKKESYYVVYFVDNTDLKDIAEEYAASRPVVLSMSVDNLKDATAHLAPGVRSQISGKIETLVENMASFGNGLCQRYDNEYYVVVTEHRHLQWLLDNSFPILREIHEVCPENDKLITLSIGVGAGQTIEECRSIADKSLETAINRGGDQAAVPKVDGGYEFVGGHTQTTKRRNKIQSRTNALDLLRHVNESDRVIIMGHSYSDLDSVGSAVGLAAMIRKCGRDAYVCLRRETTMAGRLVDYLIENERQDLFIDARKASGMATENSLLIMVDNQAAERLDVPELLEKFSRTVVIDHHPKQDPKKNTIIQPSLLLYLDNDASSTCELVTEMLPYLCKEEVDRIEAEALLAGIILDTRNFLLNTGELTFEAAAYLRSRNADTIAVKKLFSECIEFYQYKSDLISSAEKYRDMIIAVSDKDYTHYRAAAAQAADELQLLPDVVASFAVARIGSMLKVFARTLGEGCNVSLIMEAMGGGGHNTMASVELYDMTLDEAKEALKKAINVSFYGDKLVEESDSDHLDTNQ